jgi:hypothetical protein
MEQESVKNTVGHLLLFLEFAPHLRYTKRRETWRAKRELVSVLVCYLMKGIGGGVYPINDKIVWSFFSYFILLSV